MNKTIGVLSLVAVWAAGCGEGRTTTETPTVAFWSWTSPFQIAAGQAERLEALGVAEVYVRGATVSFDGGRLVPSFPAAFARSDRAPSIWLVVNFDAGALRHMREFEPSEVAEAIVAGYRRAAKRAGEKGYRSKGVQLDIDVPTSRLSFLGEVVDAIVGLEPGLRVQATGLQDWLNSPDMARLASKLDTFLPQFYEGYLPAGFDDDVPLGDLTSLKRSLPKLGRLPVRCVVGVPSYTQSLLFSPTGKRMGTAPGLSLTQALDHPGLRFLSRREVEGEWHYRFLAETGAAKGTRLLYRSVGPRRLAAFRQVLEPRRPANVIGMAVYRLPAQRDGGAIGLPGVQAAFGRDLPGVGVEVSAKASSRPFAAIEKGGVASPRTVRLEVSNQGLVDALPGERSIELVLRFAPGSLVGLSPGEARSAEPFVGEPGAVGKVGLGRADGVRFRLTSLMAGERRLLGPLTFVESSQVRAQWTVEGPDGRRADGESGIEVSG